VPFPGATVDENSLQVHISALREAFGTDQGKLKTGSKTTTELH
jgi:DNA-binding winged helix-turn-helix (wHTH) protein